jgi:hypothetical protein
LDSPTAASSGSGSSSGARAGSSSGSSGANTSSSSSSSGALASSSSSGGRVDAGCAPSCDQVKRCCPLFAATDAASLVRLCNSAAASCSDSQCMQYLSLTMGACPP